MARIEWDGLGARRYEAGCDHGVLYGREGKAFSWNGLTSVDDNMSDVNIELYPLDGVTHLGRRTIGAYSGTLKALTYPDEFLEYDGYNDIDSGFFLSGQPSPGLFGLSYRTKISTDTAPDQGYKLHILYNLMAKPDTRTSNTLAGSNDSEEFSWSLSSLGVMVPGRRPTAHIILDSTKMVPGAMNAIENFLYGTSTGDGQLAKPLSLLSLY